MQAHTHVAPLVYTTQEAACVLHIGKNKMYAIVKSGELYSCRVGKVRRIPQWSIDQYLRGEKPGGDNHAA